MTTRPATVHPAEPRTGALVDVRGPRFSAAVTAAVTATALVLQGPAGIVLVALQALVFAIATTFGLARSPWAWLFRLVRDRRGWGPPPALEDAAPPRFAQACGLAVLAVGLAALALGRPAAGWAAVAVVLALSTTLAVGSLCLGCELYVLGARLRAARRGSP
jgi:hypothetical protein